MTPTCGCKEPDPAKHESGGAYCRNCGRWILEGDNRDGFLAKVRRKPKPSRPGRVSGKRHIAGGTALLTPRLTITYRPGQGAYHVEDRGRVVSTHSSRNAAKSKIARLKKAG